MCAALNPMAAAFGLSSGAVAVAAAAAAAVFGGGGVNNPGNVGGAGPGNNLLVNLNNASYSLRIHDNTASSGTSPSSSSDYHTDRNEWMNRIESAHIDRTLMNKLVMNYLVTEGFKEAADKFGAETGICYPYDSESLNERIKIREAIENGQIERAISFINNLHPELVVNNRLLAFHLRVRNTASLIESYMHKFHLISTLTYFNSNNNS